MSTSTTVGLERTRWTAKRLLVVASLVAALAAGIFAAYVLTSSTPAADTAPASVTIEETRAGAGSCAGSHSVAGGIVEGQSVADACGAPGGTVRTGGIQP